jgi:hypothetical protein
MMMQQPMMNPMVMQQQMMQQQVMQQMMQQQQMMSPALQHGARQPSDVNTSPQGGPKLHPLSLTGALGQSCAPSAVIGGGGALVCAGAALK